jgi:RHS repeat-associated protein
MNAALARFFGTRLLALLANVAALILGLGAVIPAHGQNNAAFVSQTVPAIMTPGQNYAVSVTMQNTGTTTWTSADSYKLGSQNPLNNTKWGFSRVVLPNDVPPGQNVTFNFTVTAPTTSGMHDFQWWMVRDPATWFGSLTTNAKVAVGDVNYAQYVAQTVPTGMTANQTYAASVTMKNAGSLTWNPGSYYLRSQNPQDNLNWGVNRVELTNTVAPGENITFNFNITPAVSGSLSFRWQMAQDTANFGELTPNVSPWVNGTNAATFVSQNVPAIMEAGQTYPVTVALQNTGTTTWSSAYGYKLGSQNPQNNSTWGFNRVAVPHDVPPGQSVTFNVNVTAPATPNTYNFRWQMVRDSTGSWFGPLTPNAAVVVGTTQAAFVSQIVPATMAQFLTYPVSITMQNTGTLTWSPGQYYLRSHNSQDNYNWGLSRVELPNAVGPGQNVTLNFNVTTNSTGTVNFQWQMASGSTNFGQLSTNVPVSVTTPANNAAFVSHSVPTSMVPGQAAPVSITMQNTGTSIWKAANGFKLGSQNPPDNSIWGLNRVTLPKDVYPGENVVLNFYVTPPSAAGTYNLQWQMLEEGVQSFGALTLNATVAVQPSAQGETLYFVHADHLNTPRLIADSTGTAVWRWDQQEPFGVTPPDENPSGLGAFEFPLRFPGQYADKETGLAYNWRRDYAADLGRYVQSDPIGLWSGLNTYLYVDAMPLQLHDPTGLAPKRGSTRFRDCNPEEWWECKAICGDKGVESCGFRQTFTRTRVGKLTQWEWVDGPMSCSCNEPNTCGPTCKTVLGGMILGGLIIVGTCLGGPPGGAGGGLLGGVLIGAQ